MGAPAACGRWRIAGGSQLPRQTEISAAERVNAAAHVILERHDFLLVERREHLREHGRAYAMGTLELSKLAQILAAALNADLAASGKFSQTAFQGSELPAGL